VCQAADCASVGSRAPIAEEALRVLKKLLFAAVAAGALAAVKKRAGGKAEADLWHEATRGPQAVSTPSAS
jgi:hypothetical protein